MIVPTTDVKGNQHGVCGLQVVLGEKYVCYESMIKINSSVRINIFLNLVPEQKMSDRANLTNYALQFIYIPLV